MHKCFLFIAAVTLSTTTYAQNHSLPGQGAGKIDTIDVQGVKTYIGKEFSEGEMTQINARRDDNNSRYYGMPHHGFNFTTITGEEINKSTSQDKVSLFALWDPTCHYSLQKLNDLDKQYKDNKNFQLVVVMFDTTGIAKMITDEKLALKFAKIRSSEEMQKISCGNGYPSYVVMAKDNIIRGLGSLHKWDECMEVLKKVL